MPILRHGVTLKVLSLTRAFPDAGILVHAYLMYGFSTQNMYGIGLEEDVRSWFEVRVPKTRVARNFIGRALRGG